MVAHAAIPDRPVTAPWSGTRHRRGTRRAEGRPGTHTNNVAEYEGLIAGLAAAKALGASSVDVRMDSKLVVEQMSGRWQIGIHRCKRLRPELPNWPPTSAR